MHRLLERIQNWFLRIYQILYNWLTNLLNIFSNNEKYFIDSKDYSDAPSVQELLGQSPHHLNDGVILKELHEKPRLVQNIDDALFILGLNKIDKTALTVTELSERFVGFFKEWDNRCTDFQNAQPLYMSFKFLLLQTIKAALFCCEHYNWSIKNALLDPLKLDKRETSNSEKKKEEDKDMQAESNYSYTFNLFSKEVENKVENNVTNIPTTLSLRYGSVMDID